MKRFVRPLLITTLAAAIVLATALFASSRLAKSDYQSTAEHVDFVTMQKSVTPADDIALGGRSVSVPMSAPMPSGSAPTPKRAIPQTQIARVGSVSLLVSSVDKAVSAVSMLTRQENGDVLALEDQGRTERGGQSSANMEVRVPEDRFDSTMQALGRIGSARARSINAEDLTTQIVDSGARLRNLRRTETDIQKIMDRSGSVSQILEAENKLSSVRQQIETLDADLKSMRNRVRYSTISVTLAAEASSAPFEPTAAAQLVSSWREARHAVSQFTIGLAAAGVWIAAFIPYVLLAAFCAWLVKKRLRRAHVSS